MSFISGISPETALICLSVAAFILLVVDKFEHRSFKKEGFHKNNHKEHCVLQAETNSYILPRTKLMVKGVDGTTLKSLAQIYGFFLSKDKDYICLLSEGIELTDSALKRAFFLSMQISDRAPDAKMFLDLCLSGSEESNAPDFDHHLHVSDRAYDKWAWLFGLKRFEKAQLENSHIHFEEREGIHPQLLRLRDPNAETEEQREARVADTYGRSRRLQQKHFRSTQKEVVGGGKNVEFNQNSQKPRHLRLVSKD